MIVRLAAVGLGLLLAGCSVTVSSDVDRRDEPITATAYSKVDGVETWDLTGEPTRKSLGFEPDSSDATYETGDARAMRIVLPDRTVELSGIDISFYHGGGDDFSFGIHSDRHGPDELPGVFGDVIDQLGLDDAPVDDLTQQIGAAPAEQSASIEVGAQARGATGVRSGRWSVGSAATYTPLAKLGGVTFSGTWLSTDP